MSENEEKKQEVNVSSNQEEVENAKKKYRKPAIDKKKKQEYEDSLIQEWRRTWYNIYFIFFFKIALI